MLISEIQAGVSWIGLLEKLLVSDKRSETQLAYTLVYGQQCHTMNASLLPESLRNQLFSQAYGLLEEGWDPQRRVGN